MSDPDSKTLDPVDQKRSLNGSSTVGVGCLLAMLSAFATALMLFINGAFVFAVLSAIGEEGESIIRDQRISQFLLYTIPVGLVIIQWCMVDYVRTRL